MLLFAIDIKVVLHALALDSERPAFCAIKLCEILSRFSYKYTHSKNLFFSSEKNLKRQRNNEKTESRENDNITEQEPVDQHVNLFAKEEE